MVRLADTPPGFRAVPRTGVIYTITEATRRGYRPDDDNWANLGRGAPESSNIPEAPQRITTLELSPTIHEYAPIDGLMELRTRVAELYNHRYRQGRNSKYGPENVSISAGGRTALTRIVSTLGKTNVGHFLPDYTAYEELLDTFGTFVPIPIPLNTANHYQFTPDQLTEEILGRGLSALLFSNPCNPTGKLVFGDALQQYVEHARELSCTLILDEFYSHYTYNEGTSSVSAAEFVEDVNKDSVLIVDGLSKNWRYPGWRVAWTVGPASVIEAIASAGSFLDGGCAHPMQVAACSLVEPEIADREAQAIKKHFSAKREQMIARLSALGITVAPAPQGGFYCWGNLSALPESINTGMNLFERALDHGLIIVPGEFFDINPGQRRPDRPSRFRHYARFSFGPSHAELERGLNKLANIVDNCS